MRQRLCIYLLAKQPPHPLQNTVLLRVVRVVLGGYLEQRGESSRVCLDTVSYPLCNVLVDKQDSDILALGSEVIECRFDSSILRLCVDDEEVLLVVRRLGYVLDSQINFSVPFRLSQLRSTAIIRTPTPARSMPVTVSCD